MTIKEKLKTGQPLMGSWVQSGSPVIAEIMADRGFDFICADMEHTDLNEAEFTHIARAVGQKAAVFARVRENDNIAIRRLLDCGAEGIIVPMVNTEQDARNAVASMKYPPDGIRGFAFVRANGWGQDFDRYVAEANEKLVLIVMIETAQAVTNIDAILSVEGVDGVLIGPYDLSGSYGIVGQIKHPTVLKAKNTVLESCKQHQKAAGQHIVMPTCDNIRQAVEEGYTFLALGMDTFFVAQAADQVLLCTKFK